MVERFTGIAEAERQVRIARRLYAAPGNTRKLYDAEGQERPWDKLDPGERRPYIDQSCQGALRDDDGYDKADPQ